MREDDAVTISFSTHELTSRDSFPALFTASVSFIVMTRARLAFEITLRYGGAAAVEEW